MSIIIHQSLYGDKDGGYALLKTTFPDEKLAKKICNSTDLSDRSGPGVSWDPAIRGFKFENFFLIMKTYNTPHIRQGRVFSHVLIVDKVDLEYINDIKILFQLFETNLNTEIVLKPFLYPQTISVQLIDDNRINKAAEGLANNQTVVWVGQNGFNDLISIIWSNLWDEARFNLYFGINFNPIAMVKAENTITCIPDILLGKWSDDQFCVVNKDEGEVVPTPVGTYLINKNPSNELRSFIRDLGKKINTIDQLRLLAKGVGTYANLDNINDFNQIYNLYNIVSSYSKTDCVAIEKIFGKLLVIIPNCTSHSINALRKLKYYKQIGRYIDKVELVVKAWLDERLFNLKYNTEQNIYQLVAHVQQSDSEIWWRNSVLTVITQKLAEWKSSYSAVLWRWIDADAQNIFDTLKNSFFNMNDAESKLTTGFPILLKDQVRDFLLVITAEKKWFLLHARLLIGFIDDSNIISRQLIIDKDEKYFSALQLIANNIKPDLFLKSTLIEDDERLYRIAGKIINKSRKLPAAYSFKNIKWQKIIFYSLSLNFKYTDIFRKPSEQLVYPIFDLVIAKDQVFIDLLVLISESDYADLSLYIDRAKVWGNLTPDIRQVFLKSTAQKISNSINYLDGNYEHELENVLTTKESISVFLEKNKSFINPVIQLFGKWKFLPEIYLQDYLYYFTGEMPKIDAIELGKLVYRRKWKNCLGIIQSRVKGNDSFRTAFQECCNLLNFIEYGAAAIQGLISKIKINENDWWESFEQLLCHLYETGPIDQKVWKKSGGDEADLLHYGSGRERWHDALEMLKEGKTQKITLEDLLTRIQKDYKKNPQLVMLIELKEKL